jgi:hypothetical protein
MRDEIKREGIRPEHLEILLRIGREIVIRQCELSQQEIKCLEYWASLGMIFENSEGRNPNDSMQKEVHYVLTDKGEDYFLNYKEIFN